MHWYTKVIRNLGLLGLVLALACSGQPPLEQAKSLQSERQYEQSLAPLRRALDANPDDPQANRLFGETLLALNRPALAVWPLRRAYELMGNDREVGISLGYALHAAYSPGDAIAVADQLLAEHPDDVQLRVLRSEALRADQREEDALPDLEFLIEQEPDQIKFRADRISVLIAANRLDEADEGFDEAMELARRLFEERESGQETDPVEMNLCMGAAVFAQERGEMEKARERYESCLERSPNHLSVVQQAALFFDSVKESQRASQIVKDAAQAHPESMEFGALWAGRLFALGQAQRAEEVLLETRGSDPGPRDLATLLEFYLASEQYTKASATLEEVMEVMEEAGMPAWTPKQRFAYVDLLIEGGQSDLARAELETLESPYRELIEGKLLLQAGNPKEALEQLGWALEQWPDLITARLLAGQAAEQLGDFDRAIEEYQAGVRQKKGTSETALPLARLHMAAGEYGKAHFVVGQMLRSQTQEAEAFRILLDLASTSGNREGWVSAIQRWNQVPGHAVAIRLEQAADLSRRLGPSEAAGWIDQAGLDFSLPAAASLLMAWLEYSVEAGETESARERLEAELARAPQSPSLHEAQALLWARMGASPDDQRRALERAAELGADRPEAWLALGGIREFSGDTDAALEAYERATAYDPDSAVGRWERFELLSKLHGKASAQARAELEALLRAKPTDVQVNLALLRMLTERENPDLDRALVLARAAHRFRGGPEASVSLAQVHGLRGEPRRMLAVTTEGVARWPGVPSLHLWHGRALMRLGRNSEARTAFEKASGFENFPRREEALGHIRDLGQAPPGPG